MEIQHFCCNTLLGEVEKHIFECTEKERKKNNKKRGRKEDEEKGKNIRTNFSMHIEKKKEFSEEEDKENISGDGDFQK